MFGISDMFWALLTEDERYRSVATGQVAGIKGFREELASKLGREPTADEQIGYLLGMISLNGARLALLEQSVGVKWDRNKLEAAVRAAIAKSQEET